MSLPETAHGCGISPEAFIGWLEDLLEPEHLELLREVLADEVDQCEREQRERCELGEIHCHHPHINTAPLIIRLHCGVCDGCPECDCPDCWALRPARLRCAS